jgi:hypothetical protein
LNVVAPPKRLENRFFVAIVALIHTRHEMNARIGRPPKGVSRGEDSIFVATHLSGLKVRSVVVFKSPPAPVRKDPALRGSGKKGANAWNLFLSEKMDVRTPFQIPLLSAL